MFLRRICEALVRFAAKISVSAIEREISFYEKEMARIEETLEEQYWRATLQKMPNPWILENIECLKDDLADAKSFLRELHAKKEHKETLKNFTFNNRTPVF